MNNLLQLIWSGGNGRVAIWMKRIILVTILLVAAQVIIGVVAMFVSSCVQELTNWFRYSINLISCGFRSGNQVEMLVKLCLWLLTMIIILKIIFGRKAH